MRGMLHRQLPPAMTCELARMRRLRRLTSDGVRWQMSQRQRIWQRQIQCGREPIASASIRGWRGRLRGVARAVRCIVHWASARCAAVARCWRRGVWHRSSRRLGVSAGKATSQSATRRRPQHKTHSESTHETHRRLHSPLPRLPAGRRSVCRSLLCRVALCHTTPPR